jgi:hypothetical protein
VDHYPNGEGEDRRGLAEWMASGLYGSQPLEQADQFWLEQMLQGTAWAASPLWEGPPRGVFQEGIFELTDAAYSTFHADFSADVHKQLNQGSTVPLILGLPEPLPTAVSLTTTRTSTWCIDVPPEWR